MTATNVNVAAKGIGIGGNTEGYKIYFLDSVSKAAQNDTITITNASTVVTAILVTDAAGAAETNTISGNVITCTSATGSATVSGIIVYKE